MKKLKNVSYLAAGSVLVTGLAFAVWFTVCGPAAPEARAHGCWGSGGYANKSASNTAHYVGCPCPMCARATGFVAAEVDKTDPSAALYAAKCSACHALPSPGVHTAEDWPGVVARMEGYMDQHRTMMGMEGIGMTAEEKEEILRYLEERAK